MPPARLAPHSAAFLNPAPKAVLLALALLMMSSYTHFMYGFLQQPVYNPTPAADSRNAQSGTRPEARSSQQQGASSAGSADTRVASGQQGAGEGSKTEPAPTVVDQKAEEHRQRLLRFNKNPGLFNGQNINLEDLSGLSIAGSTVTKAAFQSTNLQKAGIHKITFRNCRFSDIDFSKADLREVVFEECSFEDVRFDEAILFNVAFIDCSMTSHRREQGFSRCRFALARLYNVSFEGLTQEDLQFFQVSGGIAFKNTDMSGMRLESDGNNKFFSDRNASNDLRVSLEDCRGGDFRLETRNLDSSLKILRSELSQGNMRGFKRAQVDNCTLAQGSAIEGREWLVVKNSTVCADLGTQGEMFLLDNSYARERASSSVNAFLKEPDSLYRTTKLRPAMGALCVIKGGKDGAWLTSFGGRLYISDLKIEMGFFDLDNSGKESELNLKNVELKRGHLYNSDLEKAYWENVILGSTLTARGAHQQKLREIQAVNVQTNPGSPFVEPEVYTLRDSIQRPWPTYKIPELK